VNDPNYAVTGSTYLSGTACQNACDNLAVTTWTSSCHSCSPAPPACNKLDTSYQSYKKIHNCKWYGSGTNQVLGTFVSDKMFKYMDQSAPCHDSNAITMVYDSPPLALKVTLNSLSSTCRNSKFYCPIKWSNGV
jgi:hypothetical protein